MYHDVTETCNAMLGPAIMRIASILCIVSVCSQKKLDIRSFIYTNSFIDSLLARCLLWDINMLGNLISKQIRKVLFRLLSHSRNMILHKLTLLVNETIFRIHIFVENKYFLEKKGIWLKVKRLGFFHKWGLPE